MVYDSKALPLMQQFLAANDAEGVAIKALLAYMQGGGKDNKRLTELTDRMTAAYEGKVKIFGEMQKYRLDK